ncbi:hypothetical protein PV433_28885 [Paenibacillus sp. GYB004]|uniref:hypothetical protein n=1 Tax=Paenibacillus sp. GYB004 TaxID=2994393 RepID=UPI002F967C93
MNWGAIVGVSLVSAAIYLFERPHRHRYRRKERIAFAALVWAGWGLAVLLLAFPDLPNPMGMVDIMFKPFGKYLQ